MDTPVDPAGESVGRAGFAALGGLAVVLTTDPAAAGRAAEAVRGEVAAIDAACSRFRADSELTRVNAQAGAFVAVGPLFAAALEAALWAAEATDGDVDPTCGAALRALGYDVDFAAIADAVSRGSGSRTGRPGGRAPGWRAVEWDPARRLVRVPAGTALDFGATAKALAADRAADLAAAAAGCGVLVSLSGDLAVRGPAPDGGWRVRVTDDHRSGDDAPGQTVTVTGGGLATSSTTVRTWSVPTEDRRGQITAHHIVDPRTGRPTDGCWRTATVAGASCLEANTVATAAIVRGAAAAPWLRRIRVPARLVRRDGSVAVFGLWPEDAAAPPPAIVAVAGADIAIPAAAAGADRAPERPGRPPARAPHRIGGRP